MNTSIHSALRGISALAVAALFSCAWSQLRQIPGDGLVGGMPSDQSGPGLAAGGGRFLAAWSDNRSNPYFSYEYETSKDIYGMRFDAMGNPLEAAAYPLCVSQGAQENPKVAWNGANWLVVFESTGLNGTGYYYQKGLAAVRVAPDGRVLDPFPIPLYGLMSSGPSYWDLASDGANWVVACQGTSSNNGIVAVRISPAGQMLDAPNRTMVQETYYMRSNLQLEYAGGNYLLTFNDEYLNGTYGTSYVRFDRSMLLLDPRPVRLIDEPLGSLASNGNVFYGAWAHQRPDWLVRVYGTRISPSGQKLDGSGVEISTSDPQAYWNIGAAWDGALWKVVWGQSNVMRMAEVRADGVVQNPGGVPVSGPKSGLIASGGDGALHTVWPDYNSANNDVWGTHIFANGSTTGTLAVSTGVPTQSAADVATSGNGYLAVFRSADYGTTRILMMPLDAAGDPVLAEPVEVASGPINSGPTAPNVAWTGSSYIVAWGSGNAIFAQRFNADGSKLDANPIQLMNGYFGPADVAVAGDTALVLGRRYFQNGQIIMVFGVRVRTTDGAVLDGTPLNLGGIYVARNPAVVELGGRFLVVYHSNATHDNPACSTLGIFVPTSGSPGSAFGIHGSFSTGGGNGIFEIGLASNGSRAIMVQSQELTSGVENDMLCRFIDAGGAVSGYQNLTPWEGNQYRPKAAWDGRHFVVVYQEQKNRLAPWTLDQIDARSDLFGMRIGADGTVLDPMGFAFSTEEIAETDPSVAALGGKAILMGSVMDNRPGRSAYRVGYGFHGDAGNQPPVAMATASPNSGDVPLVVSFSSAGTRDPDGSVASLLWDFGDGGTSTEANPVHTFTVGIPRVVRLTVTDDRGAQTTQAIRVRTTWVNKLPVAIGVAAPPNGPAPLDVVFGASGSYDPDGFLGNIQWRFGDDGSTYWGATGYHTFPNRGVWPVDLTVWDSRNATGTTRIYVPVGRTALASPNRVDPLFGRYQEGDASSLAASDDRAYVMQAMPPLTPTSPSAQIEVGFALAESTIEGLVVRVEASVTAVPAGAIRQRVQAFNWQSGQWEPLDERPATANDIPYELAVPSGAGKYVDAATKAVRLRLAWTGASTTLTWLARTDHVRLAVLYP